MSLVRHLQLLSQKVWSDDSGRRRQWRHRILRDRLFRRTASGAILHAMKEAPNPDSATKALLVRWRDGDPQAGEELAALVYANLRRLASAYMRKERPDHTLSPTGLVHEAYLRLM